jgi:hypothetical protein
MLGFNILWTQAIILDTLPSPKLDPRWALVSKTTELWELEGTFQLSALKGVEGRAEAPGWN